MAAVVTKEPLPERGREVCLIREFREEALQPGSRFLNDDVITSSSTSSCPFYPVEVDNTSALTSPDKRDHFWEVRTFQLVLKRPLEAWVEGWPEVVEVMVRVRGGLGPRARSGDADESLYKD